MDSIAKRLEAYIKSHKFDGGTSECETALDQIYQAYAESHESDPPVISEGFKELEEFLETLPLDDNNAVFNFCCRLCVKWRRENQRTACEKVYTATISSHPAVRPNWPHRRVFLSDFLSVPSRHMPIIAKEQICAFLY